MRRIWIQFSTAVVLAAGPTVQGAAGNSADSAYQPLFVPSESTFTRAAADQMVRAADGHLAPVYAPLARYLVALYGLADMEGTGIDLGGGPGNLVVELAGLTRMHWVNADINPHFFAGFFRRAAEGGVAHRVSAVFADAHALPFRDNYAEMVVSRGTYEFWPDKVRSFSEINRVLKPGGIAFIGRGLSPNVPADVARQVRSGGSGGPPYEVSEAEAELRKIMAALKISDYHILRPQPAGSEGIKYGLWIEWRKR